VNKKLPQVRLVTRELVTTLDFRGFGHAAADFYSDTRKTDVSGTFRQFPTLFPRLRCILFDGHAEFEPGNLIKAVDAGAIARGELSPPLLMSFPSCSTELPASFCESTYLRTVVYLDISFIPGSLKSAVYSGTFSPANLPDLRILKAKGREIDDWTAINLFRSFKKQLWSVDLSLNQLTDAIVPYLVSECFLPVSIRSASHFGVEGTISLPTEAGSSSYGPFEFIEETEYSFNFSHPERYLSDAPDYIPDENRPTQDLHSMRRDGRSLISSDGADETVKALTNFIDNDMIDLEDVRHVDIAQAHDGLTHLYLNHNRLSSAGIARLLRLSYGRLERLECDGTSITLPDAALPGWMKARQARYAGFVEEMHTLRPVISSNLQVLRLHHSIVTQTLSWQVEGLRDMSAMWLAENYLHPRAALASPQPFTPDTNPRLISLTLTNIPRYSSGPVIERLIHFLKCAALQERGVQEAARDFGRRTPSVLRGLRHLRLEFDPDPKEEELGDLSGDEDLDSTDLLDMAAKEFSFFGEMGWGDSAEQSRRASKGQPPETARRTSKALSADASQTKHLSTTERLEVDSPTVADGFRPRLSPSHSHSDLESEYMTHSGTWNNNPFEIQVWVGPGEMPLHPAANEYMRLLRDPALRKDVRPASPAQVAAGVPVGSYVYNEAWRAILVPVTEEGKEMREPTRSQLAGMRDVVGALKDWRAKTKRAFAEVKERTGKDGREGRAGMREVPLGPPHYFWTGKLEVVLGDSVAHYQSSKYWR
jgi:hypothetical protein